MKITPPKFELREYVALHWNEKKILGTIVSRRYYPDKDYWEYEVASQRFSGAYFFEQNLEAVEWQS